MYHTNFVHLHVHSHYSLLDGAAPVKGIVDAARRFRMPAIAITDHGNMFGAIELYQYALKRGVKPIIGFEAYLTGGSHTDRSRELPLYHIVLLARNIEGYRNLVKLSTLGFTEGFYYKPRIDFEMMEKYSAGLIALSACLAGEIPRELLKEDREAAKAAIKRYQKIFGAENFYVEIQDHGIPEQRKILKDLVDVARSCDAPIVASNDSHYVKPEDWEAQDALLCLSTNAKIDDVKRMRFQTREFYLKSPQEMSDLFAEYPEAISNTLRIAERCNVELSLGKSILPNFPIPDGKTSESYMTELCYQGMIWRYGENPREELTTRLEYELSVIKRMGFCDYFLIVWDFIKAAIEMGVPVGPGRGSAAGSIVAYLLGITDIDPIKYGLLFERFLNPERISMPDIDIDFSDDGRQRVIDYVVAKYGRNKVSSIITFNFMLAKMAIRDIGRVLGMELSEVDRIAKMVPEKPGTHLKKVLYEVPELKEVLAHGSDQQKKLLRIAETVDGLVRHTGVHACGIVISHQDLMDIVPLYLDKNKELMTQYEKNAIESIGLLKMDFLGLKTLTIIQRALENIKVAQGIELDLTKAPIDDPKSYELLQQALTMGIFQLESAGMRNLIARLKPSVFEDIIALLAMYRPGPLSSGMVDDFVERKHGRKSLDYPHPDLEPVLKDTYGVFLYQEQVMQTANILANFSMAQADALRKAMGKKIAEVMEKMGKLFVKGAVERGVPQEKAQEIFDLMAGFAEYGFNKSHSAAYAVITFRTAYLKAHYPVEFMAAVLSAEISNTDKVAEYVDECRTINIEILTPDVNISESLFKVDKGNVRFGMSAIKGVGASAVESIVATREKDGPFKSLGDFTRRVNTSQVNSRVIDALIKAGAFDSFGLKKSQLIAMSTEALKSGQSAQKSRSAGQITFFDVFGEDAEGMGDIDLTPPDVPELTEKELLASEKEVFGFYLTGDPFNAVAPLGRVFSTHTLSGILEAGEGKICRIAGILTAYKRHITKKGDYMAFLTIEADNASLDVTLFPRSYQEYHHQLKIDEPMFMVVQTQLVDGTVKINAEKILTIDDFNEEGFSKITFEVPPSVAMRENYQKLLGILQKSPGNTPFLLKIYSPEGPKVLLKPPARFRINLNPGLIKSWEKLCGRNSLKIEFPLIEVVNQRNNRYRKGFKTAEG